MSAAFSRRAVGQLAGQAQPPRRRLPGGVLVLLAADAVFGPLDHEGQQVVGRGGIAGQEMVEPVAQRGFDQAGRLGAGQFLLGLALELRVAQEQRQLRRDRIEHVVGGDLRRPLVAAMLAPGAQALDQRGAEAGLVRAALRRRARCCSRSAGSRRPAPARPPPIRPCRWLRPAGPPRPPRSAAAPCQVRRYRQPGCPAGRRENAARLGRDVVLAAFQQRQARRSSGFRRRGTGTPWSGTAGTAGWARTPALPKISGSGLKRMVVPRRLCTGPALISLVRRLALGVGLLPQHPVARDLDLHRPRTAR